MIITDVVIYCDETLTRLPVTHPNKEVSSLEALERYRALLKRKHKGKRIIINHTDNPKVIHSCQEWTNWIEKKNEAVKEAINDLSKKLI